MKKKLLVGCGGLLLAASSMFAGWGDRYHDSHERYVRRGGVYVGVAPGYTYGYAAPNYGYSYTAPAPYPDGYVAPAPYVNEYVAPAPYVGSYYGGAWTSDRWRYERRDHDWRRDHRDHWR